jgi:hypothetical protein
LKQGETVEFWEHDVDHGGVVGNAASHDESVLAVGTVIDGKAALLQPVHDERSDLLVVFDYEYSHRCGRRSRQIGIPARHRSGIRGG